MLMEPSPLKYNWGMAKALCSWMLFPIVRGGWRQTSTCSSHPFLSRWDGIIHFVLECSVIMLFSASALECIYFLVQLTVSKTEEWTGRRDIELRAHVPVWDLQTAVKWACKGSMRMGHVDVRLHPPHTIRNSIQLQAALAIPQVCSLSCKLARTLGCFGWTVPALWQRSVRDTACIARWC